MWIEYKITCYEIYRENLSPKFTSLNNNNVFFFLKRKKIVDSWMLGLRKTFLKTFQRLPRFKNFKILHLWKEKLNDIDGAVWPQVYTMLQGQSAA